MPGSERRAGRRTPSARSSPPGSRSGCASRRSSTSVSSWRCCPSRASRCRSSVPEAPRSSSASPPSASCSRSRGRRTRQPRRRFRSASPSRGGSMRLLIAGGGTGGHIYPALAVADALRRRATGADLAWVGGHRGLEASLFREAGIPLRRLALRSLRSVEVNAHLVLDPIRLAASVPEALWILGRRRPAAIFTTGGYVAIPVVVAARLLGIPVLLW